MEKLYQFVKKVFFFIIVINVLMMAICQKQKIKLKSNNFCQHLQFIEN